MTPNANQNETVVSTETTPLIQAAAAAATTTTTTTDDNDGSVTSNSSSWQTIQYGQPTDERTTTTTTSTTRIPVTQRTAQQQQQQPLEDYSETSKISTATFDKSIQHSIRNIRDHLVRAHSKLEEIIQYHTGSIGMLGSISIAVNSLTGPAMLNLPATFARSGLIPTVVCLLFVCFLSSLCCLHLASVISKVPGNANFKKEIEYSEAFSYFWGSKWFTATQILFLCCVLCLNISSIVDMSQVADTFVGHWFPHGGTAAIQIITNTTTNKIQYNWIRWDYTGCTENDLIEGLCTPFRGINGLLITAGKLITIAFYLPLALMDLKENAHWQVVGFFILIVCSIHFCIQFATFSERRYENLTYWGHDWTDLFGVVLFNFALVIAVPAWLYEREAHVDVPTVINWSSVMSFFLYLFVGTLGCIAMPNVADNMLQSMMSGAFGLFTQFSASVFAFGIVGLGIPLFSVLTRLNLTSSGLCSLSMGQLLAVYLPFTVALFLYDGTDVTTLLSWGGVIFTSLIVFILPLLLALHVVQDYYEFRGSISLYFGFLTSKSAQINALRILLILAAIAVLCALGGNFYSVVIFDPNGIVIENQQ